jgi:hypothetical protein
MTDDKIEITSLEHYSVCLDELAKLMQEKPPKGSPEDKRMLLLLEATNRWQEAFDRKNGGPKYLTFEEYLELLPPEDRQKARDMQDAAIAAQKEWDRSRSDVDPAIADYVNGRDHLDNLRHTTEVVEDLAHIEEIPAKAV